MEPLLLGRREAAEALGISLRLLDYLVSRGELPARRIGRRVCIPRSELEKFARCGSTTRKADRDGRSQ